MGSLATKIWDVDWLGRNVTRYSVIATRQLYDTHSLIHKGQLIRAAQEEHLIRDDTKIIKELLGHLIAIFQNVCDNTVPRA